MKLKRFLTDEEYLKFKELSKNMELVSEKAYSSILKSDTNNENFNYITKVLKDIIDGFRCFNAFVKNDEIRLHYNYNYDDKNMISFSGVGYITIEELKNGFTAQIK